MRVLIAHNRYQIAGGEDSVLESERQLLEENGEEVVVEQVDNDAITTLPAKLKAAWQATYSPRARRAFLKRLEAVRPDIVHVHNFFPLLTPSIYDACADQGVPVVQTMHNYRTICAGALLMRDGVVCERCVTGSPYQAARFGCYRGSKIGSLAVARMVATHRRLRTFSTKVHRVIALTEFAKTRFVAGGFDPDRIAVKPNFITDPMIAGASASHDDGCLFVGRISVEKGVATLLRAWEDLDEPLRIAGTGPLYEGFRAGGTNPAVTFLGSCAKAEVFAAMSRAKFLVMPSLSYEGFPIVMVEAFAHGLPVICSRLGGMEEVVEDGVTGLHFNPGDPQDLAAKVRSLATDPERCRAMGEAARARFLADFGPAQNYEILTRIYRAAQAQQQSA